MRIIDGDGRPSDVDLLLDVCDNISPAIDLAAAADHDLPARTLGGVAHRLGRARGSATSSSATSERPVEITVPMNGAAYTAAPEPAEVGA